VLRFSAWGESLGGLLGVQAQAGCDTHLDVAEACGPARGESRCCAGAARAPPSPISCFPVLVAARQPQIPRACRKPCARAANPARVPQARQEGALLQRRAEAAEAEAAAQRAAARRDLRRAAREAADAGEEAARLREAVRDLRVRCREAALDAEAARGRRGGAFAPPLRCARPLQPAPACGLLEAGGAAWRGAARKRRAGDHMHGKRRSRMGRAAVQTRCRCSYCSNFLGMRGMHAVQARGTAGSVPCTTAPGPAGVMIRARSPARRAASQRPSL